MIPKEGRKGRNRIKGMTRKMIAKELKIWKEFNEQTEKIEGNE